MLVSGAYEKARQYIESHSLEEKEKRIKKEIIEPGPCITISRETGAGAGIVAEKLIDNLKLFCKDRKIEWAVFDRNLIEKVLEDHNLPDKLRDYFDEDRSSSITSIMNELLGLHPSILQLVKRTTQTILQLAQVGYVVIVGRASNIITAKLENSFHVRLVAPLENKITQVKRYYGLGDKEAVDFIRKEDQARKNYVKKYFGKNSEDSSLYHLTLNTGLCSYEQCAEIISYTVMKRFPEYFVERSV